MLLRTNVIVTNISNLSDARYCAGMGVNKLAFRMDDTEDGGISPDQIKEIAEWVSGVDYVVEFKGPIDVNKLKELDIKTILVHHPDQVTDDENRYGLVINNTQLDTPMDLSNLEFVLVKSIDNSWDEASKEAVKELNKKVDVYLQNGFDQSNIDQLLNDNFFSGIVLTGTDEIRPGYKDYDALADILELLEVED